MIDYTRFLSQWSSRESHLYPAHHGEKSEKLPWPSTYMATQMNIFGITSLEMEKRRLMDIDVDSESLVCVNPHEVLDTAHSPAPISLTDTNKDNPVLLSTETSGGYQEPRKIKLEMDMEVFSDLSPFVFPRLISTNSIDELNTPVFDKDAFDFGITNSKYCQSDEIFVKLEHDYYGNILSVDNNKFKDTFVDTRNSLTDTRKTIRNQTASSDVSTTTVHLQNSAMNIISSEPENESVFIQKISPTYANANTSISTYNVDDSSALSVNNNRNCYSNVSSPNSQIEYTHILAPSSSNEMKNTSQNLTLNVNLRMPQSGFDLATPSIIDSVVDLEAENFNILDIVSSEDIPSDPKDLLLSLPSSFPVHSTISAAKTIVIAEKNPRKRLKHDDDDDDDDDEDYIPPSKKRAVSGRKAIVKDLSEESDSDSDAEIEVKFKGRPRGRPPKRTGSVSSECSKDSDASKYRELRDKNNEASRKSRLKRKLKEMESEKEADELTSKNIKLKAQVEELEKMVTNFRENLFKIMIKK